MDGVSCSIEEDVELLASQQVNFIQSVRNFMQYVAYESLPVRLMGVCSLQQNFEKQFYIL